MAASEMISPEVAAMRVTSGSAATFRGTRSDSPRSMNWLMKSRPSTSGNPRRPSTSRSVKLLSRVSAASPSAGCGRPSSKSRISPTRAIAHIPAVTKKA